MTRSQARSYNWRTDTRYHLKEGHENKMMRPSTHALLDKLRNMKMMQEPGMVNLVIHDLAHWMLYRNKEVVLLGKATADLMSMWTGLVQNEEGKPAYIFGQPENHGHNGTGSADLPPGGSDPALPGDSPGPEVAFAGGPGMNLKQFLTKIETKHLLEEMLELHVPGVGRPAWAIRCGCGKEFAHSDEWRRHARIRISTALLNEFPPFGKGEDNG